MKWYTRLKLLLCLMIVSICLSSCALLMPASASNIKYYTITTPAMVASMPVRHGGGPSLLVLPPVTIPELSTEKMCYVIIPHQIDYFAKNQWIAPPSQMLMPLITQTINRTNAFAAVVSSPFVGNVDYRLNTELLAFQQEFLTKPSEFHMILSAQIINANNDRIIASSKFETMVRARTDNPYGGVMAATEATDIVLARLAGFCAATVGGR